MTERGSQADAYRQGATQSLAVQRQFEATGQREAARIAAASVDANLDALAEIEKKN